MIPKSLIPKKHLLLSLNKNINISQSNNKHTYYFDCFKRPRSNRFHNKKELKNKINIVYNKIITN